MGGGLKSPQGQFWPPDQGLDTTALEENKGLGQWFPNLFGFWHPPVSLARYHILDLTGSSFRSYKIKDGSTQIVQVSV